MRYFSASRTDPYASALQHLTLHQKWRNEIQIQNNTSLVRYGYDRIDVVFHNTHIVQYYQGTPVVTLNSGGWETPTTKDRIQSYSGVRIFSKRGLGWHIPNDEYTPIKNRKCSCCHGQSPEFETTLGKLAGLKCKCGSRYSWYQDTISYNCFVCRDTGYIQTGGQNVGIKFYSGIQFNMSTQEVVSE